MRFAVLTALLPIGVLNCAVEAAEPEAAPYEGPVAVVLPGDATVSYVDPIRSVPAPHTLAPGTRVEVLALGTVPVGAPDAPYTVAPRHLVRRAGGAASFWVDGGRLAIASTDGSLHAFDPFDATRLQYLVLDLDGDGTREQPFVGVRAAFEKNKEDEPGFPEAELMLARQGSPPISVQRFSGWGTSAVLRDAVVVDLDADGRQEWLLGWDTTVTEVGAGGMVVQHVGLDAAGALAILGEMQLNDPRRNGLRQTRFGVATLTGSGISQLGVDLVDCEVIEEGACFSGWRTYAHQQVRHPREEEHTPREIAGFVEAAVPLVDGPSVEGAEAMAPGRLAGERVQLLGFARAADEGPASALWIERDGRRGWVPFEAVRWEEPPLRVALFGDAGEVARTDWLRPM